MESGSPISPGHTSVSCFKFQSQEIKFLLPFPGDDDKLLLYFRISLKGDFIQAFFFQNLTLANVDD